VLLKYGLGRVGLPVYCAPEVESTLAVLVGGWGDTFDWRPVDGDDERTVEGCRLRFSRTVHPVPCLAVEVTADGKRLVYTSDTGPEWSVGAFGPGADLVLSEASSQDGAEMPELHLTARQAGSAARAAAARRLMLTHLWPRLDPQVSIVEGSEAFGRPVMLAAPNERVRI
jgi:ribonuclease BN (tRNA processing enzyme)